MYVYIILLMVHYLNLFPSIMYLHFCRGQRCAHKRACMYMYSIYAIKYLIIVYVNMNKFLSFIEFSKAILYNCNGIFFISKEEKMFDSGYSHLYTLWCWRVTLSSYEISHKSCILYFCVRKLLEIFMPQFVIQQNVRHLLFLPFFLLTYHMFCHNCIVSPRIISSAT